ncbi:unnamed protein product [Phaeothamnion confervicola]
MRLSTSLVEVQPALRGRRGRLCFPQHLSLLLLLSRLSVLVAEETEQAKNVVMATAPSQQQDALLLSLFKLLSALERELTAHLPLAVAEALASFDALAEAHAGLPHASAAVVGLLALLGVAAVVRFLLGGLCGGRRDAGRGHTLLVVGPCNSGKTALCYRLAHGGLPETVTSMKPQEYPCPVPFGADRPVTIVDFPGHERLRGGLRAELRRAAAVVFLIDGADVTSQLRPAGELLYDVLSDPAASRWRGVLLLAGKADLRAAKLARLKAALAAELDKLRETRRSLSAEPDSHGGDNGDDGGVLLGRPGTAFDLDVDAPCPVTMGSCSVMAAATTAGAAGGAGLAEVEAFLSSCFR